jgi:hypothetical protein
MLLQIELLSFVMFSNDERYSRFACVDGPVYTGIQNGEVSFIDTAQF